MTGKENTYQAVVFEYYDYRAKTLPLPKAAFSICHDDQREVFLKYDYEPDQGGLVFPGNKRAV